MKTPFEFSHLDHLVLRTADLPRLRDFYIGLGCTVERDLTEKLGMVQLKLGSSMLDIVDASGKMGRSGGVAPGKEGRNLDHYAVRIATFDQAAILSFCEKQGIEAEAPSFPLLGADGYGPAVYIRDPDGNRMELKGPPNEDQTPPALPVT